MTKLKEYKLYLASDLARQLVLLDLHIIYAGLINNNIERVNELKRQKQKVIQGFLDFPDPTRSYAYDLDFISASGIKMTTKNSIIAYKRARSELSGFNTPEVVELNRERAKLLRELDINFDWLEEGLQV